MHKSNRPSQGFTLIEVSIAIAVSMMLAAAMLWPQVVRVRHQKAVAQGTQLATLSKIVATFMTRNYGNLVGGTAVAGVANPYAPTIAELQNWGLPANFLASNQYGGGYAVQITKTPAGCVAPNCDLTSLVYLTTPITNPLTGRIDGSSLGEAVEAMGDDAAKDAGWSTIATPGRIAGQGGTWSVTNPLNVAGILGMRAGYGSSGMAQFMRRDGTLPATGAQDMGGQDVNNVNTLRSATISNSGNASVGGTLAVAGQTTTNGINNSGAVNTTTANVTNAITAGSATINGPATVSGQLTAGNTTINGSATINGAANITGALGAGGAVTLASTLTVNGNTVTNGLTNNGKLTNTGDVQTGRLYLTTIVSNGAACAGLTGYQAATTAGSIASCINGTWQTPAANIPPPSPCNSAVVSFQGCSGTVPYTQSGSTAPVTVTSGTGSATYSCNNGSWAFMSGNCTPPPAGCPAQDVYWTGGASCSGKTADLSSGSSAWVNSSNANNGSVYVTCKNGSLTQTSSSCDSPGVTFWNPTSAEGTTLASNPSLRASFCANNGHLSPAGYGETDYGGSNLTICWSIDGMDKCTGGDNCKNYSMGTPGCWVQTYITCK